MSKPNKKFDPDKLPPRFGAKTSHKRKPTKRHLQDRLKSVKKELAQWEARKERYDGTLAVENWFYKTTVRWIDKTKTQITMLENLIAEFK